MKILIAISLALSLCNIACAQHSETTQPVTRILFSPENGCQYVDMFFKFTNQLKGDELVQYIVSKNFNMETTLPISKWGRDQGTVSLPQGDSKIYKNTYTADQSILTGAVIYSSDSKKVYRTLCSLTFYHDEQESGCGSVIVMTGGHNCMPLRGYGTEQDPYVLKIIRPD